jgi:hypothetical protein
VACGSSGSATTTAIACTLDLRNYSSAAELRLGFQGNFWQATWGLNWKPTNNWIIRPEMRYDWYTPDKANGNLPFGSNFDKYGQLYGGCDAIWQF